MSNTEESIWTFRIKDENGNVLANLLGATKRQVKLGLNKAGEASFSYNLKEFYDLATKIGLTPESLIGLGRNTLECLRNTTVMFAGEIINLNQTMDEVDANIEVKAVGWYWLLGTRFVGLITDKVYTAIDAGSIAWDLINTTQLITNGSFGITQGTIQVSVNRTLTYSRKPIKDAIDELANTDNGFEFEITPAKVFNVYYPQKGSNLSNTVILRYPGNVIKSIEKVSDVSEMANSVLAIGSGAGLEEISAQRDSVANQLVYKVRQTIYPVKDLNNATVLGDIAQQQVDTKGQLNPYYRIKIYGGNSESPSIEDFHVGDSIRVVSTETFFAIDQIFRVFEIYINVDDVDMEIIELIVGLV